MIKALYYELQYHFIKRNSVNVLSDIYSMKQQARSASTTELIGMKKQTKRIIFQDYRSWLTRILEHTEQQLAQHDTRATYKTIKQHRTHEETC